MQSTFYILVRKNSACGVAAQDVVAHKHTCTLLQEMGPSPESANVVVAPVAPPSFQLTRLVPCPHPEAGGPPCVRLLSCLGNDVSRHMMGGADHDHGHEEEEEEEEGIDMLRGMEEGMAVDGQSSDEGDDDKDEVREDGVELVWAWAVVLCCRSCTRCGIPDMHTCCTIPEEYLRHRQQMMHHQA